MKKRLIVVTSVIFACMIITATLLSSFETKTELKSIKSMKELQSRFEAGDYDSNDSILNLFLTMPWSFIAENGISYLGASSGLRDYDRISSEPGFFDAISSGVSIVSKSEEISESKEYGTTNIQVENVDEADIIKTDGDYIYSLSEQNVIITNVLDERNPKISAKIAIQSGIPQDLILYDDKLIVISATDMSWNSSYYSDSNTLVEIYNITDREKPDKLKSFSLHQSYYTSRCIGNRLYVISSGYLREKDRNTFDMDYEEDNETKTMNIKDIKYFTDIYTDCQTLISFVDLDNPTADVSIYSYLIDISNAYVSEKSIYLANDSYYESERIPLRTLFGIKGIWGPIEYAESQSYDGETNLYKFDILDNGNIKYRAKAKIDGNMINQFSMDEYEGNFRVALWDWSHGTRVVIYNDELKQIGHSEYLAKGEQMYSSRFMGDKAYLITYFTTDPLYVIDLSDPTKPNVLGELKIPGYSTYLHPYDENHLIGFGMESEEIVTRDANGKVTSTRAVITGMKMALFDVTDVHNPSQIANEIIGDSRTTSSILTNHKALLFSKEKELLAIPVNHYQDDFQIKDSDSAAELIEKYIDYEKPYISEGYFVYNINLSGFVKKGVITHDVVKSDGYGFGSRLLRGVYIDNNLFTVSEDALKVNKIDNLEQISEIKIKGEQ